MHARSCFFTIVNNQIHVVYSRLFSIIICIRKMTAATIDKIPINDID